MTSLHRRHLLRGMAVSGAFPSYSAVPMTDRGKVVLSGCAYRDALLGAVEALGLA